MPPPAAKKASRIWARTASSAGSSPTLKVIQVPMPITGSGSPLTGIGLVSGETPAALAKPGQPRTAPAAAAS